MDMGFDIFLSATGKMTSVFHGLGYGFGHVPFVLNRFLMVYSLRAGRFITCKKDTLPKSHQNRDTNRTFLQFLANTRF